MNTISKAALGKAGIVAMLMTILLVAVWAVTSSRSSGSADTARRPGVQTSAITSTRPVLTDQHDFISPLPQAKSVSVVSAIDVITQLAKNDPAAGSYLRDLTKLEIALGAYTNEGLLDQNGRGVTAVPAYVITGGSAPCSPAGPAGSDTSDKTCSATIIVDAVTSELLMIDESWDI